MLEEGAFDGDELFRRILAHKVIQEVDTDENIVIKTILAFDKGFNYLQWDTPRLLNNYLMGIITGVSAGSAVTLIKVDGESNTVSERKWFNRPSEFIS